MSVRLYNIIYLEEEEVLNVVVPEWMLPDIEDLQDISLAGYLIDGYKIVEDDEPEPGDKEDAPIPLRTGTQN